MPHFLLVSLFFIPICLLFIFSATFVVIGYILGGRHSDSTVDSGLAGVFNMLGDMTKSVIFSMRRMLTARKPIAYTFNGAVKKWRVQLATFRKASCENLEYSDMIDCMRKENFTLLGRNFDFSNPPKNNTHYKLWRFAKYIQSKQKST